MRILRHHSHNSPPGDLVSKQGNHTAFLSEISLHVFINFSWKLNAIATQHGSMNSIHSYPKRMDNLGFNIFVTY